MTSEDYTTASVDILRGQGNLKMQKIVQKLHETVTQSKSQYCAINFCTK